MERGWGMKKSRVIAAVLVCCLLSALSGCKTAETNEAMETDGAGGTSKTVQEPETHITGAELENTGNKDSWIDAFCQILKEDDKGTHITLADVNFDGIPELFYSQLGTSNTWIDHGYSYSRNGVMELVIPDGFMPMELELYRDKKSNERFWLANGMYRDGATYSYVWYKTDFRELSDIRETLFFKWSETLNGERESCEVTYRLAGEDGSTDIVSKDEIDKRKEELFSGYERLDGLSLFSFRREFAEEERRMADQSLFYTFARLYDTISRENSLIGDVNGLRLPVYSVVNQNLYNDYQISEPSVSLVRLDGRRQDETNGADIYVGYVQLSRLPSEEIRAELNDKLKEFAFSDWDVETEKGIELNILEIPSVYKKYLSVQKVMNCYLQGAAHPWQDFSALTFDLTTGKKAALTDIVNVDDRLRDKIYAGDFKADRATHEQCVEAGLYGELWNSILESTENSRSYHNFYLTERTLGFVLGVPHSIGDYITFEIPFSELTGLDGELFGE